MDKVTCLLLWIGDFDILLLLVEDKVMKKFETTNYFRAGRDGACS